VLRLSCIAAILFAIVSISAQVAPGPRAGQRAATPVPAPAPTPPEMVKLQYPNSDVLDILRLYEQWTGKKLVIDNFVQGKVTIFISKDLPKDEAIKIIEMNLSLNGFSLVPADNDIIEVVGTGKNPRAAAVPIISDVSEIPPGDQMISYLFKLHYADVTELQQVLVQYLAGAGPNTAPILALPKSGSLIVTQSAGIVRRLVKIVEQIDNPPAEVVSEFIKLERADAAKVVDMLEDIFEKKTNQQGVPGAPVSPRGVRQLVPPPNVQQNVPIENDLGALTALSEDSVIIGKIKLAADIRTNRIHVITRPTNMPFIRKLIAEFDANVEFAKPVTRPLRYISAADVLPVLVQALTEPGTQTEGGAPGGNPNAPGAQATPRRPSNTANPYSGANTSTSTSTGGGESSLNVSEELSTQPVDTTPKAVTVGNAKIIADQRANTIIVLGNREVVVKVGKILDEMDVKAPQVALSTVIGELTLHGDEEFGVDYFLKYKNKVVSTSRNTSVPIPAGSPITVTTGVAPGPVTTTTVPGIVDPSGLINFSNIIQNVASGTNVYVAAGNYLSAIVHLLNSTGNFKVISRPMVFTSNNKKAIIASGTEIPVPVSTLSSVVNNTGTTGTNIGQQSNIQFKKVALQLEVVPLINSESEVSLDILQKLDSLAGSQVIDGNAIPTIATRYIRTNVSAPNGSTIVLGGLITDSKNKTTSGIPVLDRIPLLGYLFRNTSKIKDRTELIILMRPEVSLTKLDLYRLRRKTEDRTHFGPELEQDDCPDCPTSIDGKQLMPQNNEESK
jgi:type II secretion system protein D